jgi:hypothetical protein
MKNQNLKPVLNNSFRIVSRNCVNSKWTASFLQKKGLDSCQCGFECKIRVEIRRNGHKPYEYIITKKEYNKLRKELQLKQDYGKNEACCPNCNSKNIFYYGRREGKTGSCKDCYFEWDNM